MRSAVWRLAMFGLALFGGQQDAAAQAPVLRGSYAHEVGPPSYRDWGGFYIGGQAGYASTNVNFSGGVSALVANILRFTTVENEFHPSDWASLPQRSAARPSYGGFVGYNVQFDDTVLGIEANYNRTSIRLTSGDTVGRQVQTSEGYLNQVTVSGTGTVHLTDYGTLRARAGWIYNNFIPYGFFGLAIGRANVARTASVTLTATDTASPPVLPDINFAASQSESATGAFGYGWTLGAGVDWAVLPNVFVRGEYEYVSIPDFQGVNIVINTFRAAAGVKF